jgi:hypothetical protein
MLSTTASLKGRFLAVPRPERFTSLRSRPWHRWEETDVFHLKHNRCIDVLDSDGDGQHALRVMASSGGVDITGSFQWREATEGRKNELLLAVRARGESQTDVAMFGYVFPAAFVVGAPLAIWYGGMFFDFAAALAGVVVTSMHQHAQDVRRRYATPRWLDKYLENATVHGVDNPALAVRDPRSLFLAGDEDGDGEDGSGTPPATPPTPSLPPATGPTSGAGFLEKI